ncbi:ribosome biogenesis GTPase YlqF [Oxynema aestuarii]|jgi:ribosome biogenesis GTPase A|uniref:Ribosome biogenesis GTPase A n=1 Tax=Oxynema aestuarii AP17 TaxID=2064643 RepID=A0A6H1TS79_9CYAN|nr:ribosome biogenesis GTPase YlqF [Oxynema aestuarii]QIZ69454.1 ribosome biogenesis GTPase YlqF [Oxynema aestuarii AP17]RMH76333.1 MAG: ribosome biogenesis GTPase YlqF [Cyanobacteria bacterium J007]
MTIQWYPGHIAKAERQLKEQLKLVDVVLEVRDARIPLTTHHPQVQEWVGSKERVLVINRVDTIPKLVENEWRTWFEERGETPYFTNAQQGDGVRAVAQAAKSVSDRVNRRRRDRGMRPRPVRAVVIGFPNVGKSALINRLLGRRVVESARRPGVTRQLRWVKISKELELLDAPGVIPTKLDDPQGAVKLAICDDIGDAAYENLLVAAELVELICFMDDSFPGMGAAQTLKSRYDPDPFASSGEQYIHAIAASRYQGDVERAARQLLNDFRKGLLGAIALELPPI